MKILVCVKKGFPADKAVVIDESTGWICDGQSCDLPPLGRYDEMAVEQALAIRDKNEKTGVEVITAGPIKDSVILRRAMGMGADWGIHVITDDDRYVSPRLTAHRLAQAVGSRQYDIVMTGAMSDDMAQGLVGPILAEMLGMPCVTSTAEVFLKDHKTIIVKRDVEGLTRQVLEVHLPALVTVQGCSGKPRYPSLSNIMRANSQDMETIDHGAFREDITTEALVKLVYPQKNRSLKFLQGSSIDKANELASILRSRGFLS